MKPTQTVQSIYAAFGRGDVPAILACLSEETRWDYAYEHAPNPAPWLKARRGKADVAQFFAALAALEFHRFEAAEILEGPGVVVALIRFEATVRATGKRIVEHDEAHIWRFDASGKVVQFRHCADTFQHVQALSK